jgi:membrane protease YdiL (CAAX protease family)
MLKPLLTLVLVCLLTGLALSYLAMALLPAFFGLNMSDLMTSLDSSPKDMDSILIARALFLVQGLSSLGFFVLPGWWFIQNYSDRTRISFRFDSMTVIGSSLITVLCLPLVYNLFHLNQGLPYSPIAEAFPTFKELTQSWQETEQNSQHLLTLLLNPDGVIFGMLGIVVLAILPALGEEMVFRGSLQPMLQKFMRNPHLGVWVSAILFSAIHGQWLGFVPRCLLGALFGYMVLWFGSLWPAILAHMTNNLFSFVAYKFNWFSARDSQNISEAAFRWDDNPSNWVVALGLWVIAMVGLFYLQRSFRIRAANATANDLTDLPNNENTISWPGRDADTNSPSS